jgi:serine/threonine protein kinase
MHKSKIINTRQYRSPEVILELGWSYPSDVWSAACVVAEIASGDLLFSTHDDLEHLGLIERMVEPVPEFMRSRSPVGAEFFDNGGRDSRGSSKRGGYSNTSSSGSINIDNGGTFGWTGSRSNTKTNTNKVDQHGKSAMPLRSFDLCRTSFEYVKQAHTLAYFTDPQDRDHGDDLADLLWSMLRVDPALRAQPRECLKHSYFDDIVEDP